MIVIAGSSAGRDDHTAAVVAQAGTVLVHGVAVRPGHPVVLGRVGDTAVLGAPGYPVSAALTFDIFAPRCSRRSRAPRRWTARARRRAWRGGSPPRSAPTTGSASASAASAAGSSPRRSRAAPASSPRSCAPTACSSCPRALEGHDAGAEVEVRLLRDLDAVERTIVAIGSHDPVLDLAASLLRARDPRQTLVSGMVGSLGGLVALRDGLCHVAGCHLLDPATGEYTLPWIARVLPDEDVAVVRLVHREQGLIVARRQPARRRRPRRPARACAT